MIARRAADLAYTLERSGVPVTLGGASTSALVAAADERVLQEAGSPVALIGKAVLVTIAKDALPGLIGNATLVVTAGPLAGTYKADRILGESDGELTRFLAYPTEAITAPAFWSRGAILLPWALREPGAAPGPAFDRSTIEGTAVLTLEVEAGAAGTDPALNVKLQDCATAGGTFVDTGLAFEELGAAGGLLALVLDPAAFEQFVKLVPLISGTDEPAFRCGAAALDFAMPR